MEIEENLPEIIADDLLLDEDSAHAPVLQILLTKMWEEVEQDTDRRFTVEAYNKMAKEGILLDDFLWQQMEKIRNWDAEIEGSGLLLDILGFHTTPHQTAHTHSLEKIRKRYQHREGILAQLILKCKELFLLDHIGNNRTQLSHDTLAPLVYRAWKDSNRPGQQAARILENKLRLYESQPEAYISPDDLDIVESGQTGMRFWTKKERKLIEKSRKQREKLQAERKRNRRFRQIAIALLAIFFHRH